MGKIRATGRVCVRGLCAGLILAASTSTWGVETTSEHFVAKASLINGNNGGGQQRYSYLAVAMFHPSSFAGTVTAVSSNAVIDANASWTQNQFDGTNGVHYIEFENGAMADILLTDAATRSLSFPGTLPEGVTVGDSFKVRKHTTIADIFGPNNETGLQAGLNSSQADNILLSIPETQDSVTLFYANIPGFEGWYRFDYFEASKTVVYPEQAFIIRRRGAEDLTLLTDGVAKQGPTRFPIFPGYNLINTAKQNGGMTLNELGLFTGDADTGLAPGRNANEADNVVLILPDQTSAIYFYFNLPGFTGWYDFSYNPADQTVIEANTAFFIHRKSQRPMFQWAIPSE